MTHKIEMMQIVNLTPNSFSDGNINNNEDSLTQLVGDRASICSIWDFGAESTAPFNAPITSAEEISRFEEAGFFKIKFSSAQIISIDTYRFETFFTIYKRLRSSGNQNEIWWNDVSGLIDENVFNFFENTQNSKYIFAHNNVPSRDVTSHHMDFVSDVSVKQQMKDFVLESLANFSNLTERVIIDPCFGFAKSRQQNLELLECVDEFISDSTFTWMIGISRKSFLRDEGEKLNDKKVLEKCESLQRRHIRDIASKCPQSELIIRVHDSKYIQNLTIAE